jgi:hypothetical protein
MIAHAFMTISRSEIFRASRTRWSISRNVHAMFLLQETDRLRQVLEQGYA